jgi:hypothetical protein
VYREAMRAQETEAFKKVEEEEEEEEEEPAPA